MVDGGTIFADRVYMPTGVRPWLLLVCCWSLAGCAKQNPIWNLVGGGGTDSAGAPASDDPVPTSGVTESGDAGSGSSTIATSSDTAASTSSTSGDDTTGSTSAAASATQGSTGTLNCGGLAHGGHCWYFGALGESCEQTCNTHAGIDEHGTYVFVGSGAPNPSRCEEVMEQFGVFDQVVSVQSTDGYGCHWWEDQIHWESGGPTLPDVFDADSRRMCACLE